MGLCFSRGLRWWMRNIFVDKMAEKIIQYEKKVIFTCSSVYHVLVTMCLILILKNYSDFYVIMFSPVKKDIQSFTFFSKKMSKMGIRNVVIDKHTRLHRAIGLSSIQNTLIFNKVLRDLHVEKEEYLLVNFAWKKQLVAYPASIYFKYCYGAIFIEEGATQYVTPKENNWYVLLKKIYGNQTEFWKSEKLISIFVQFPNRFPKYLSAKMRGFSWEGVERCLSEKDKKKLIYVFTLNSERKGIWDIRKKPSGIIFTQPLSEDGYITTKKKKEIYKQMTEFYSKYGKTFLKIHPRDTMEYCFADVIELRGTYPSELFRILGIKFEFAVGLCTSAIETVEAKQKFNLNENFLTDLKYEFKYL